MPYPQARNAYAEATINVSRICVAGSTHPNSAKQAANATVRPIGISQNGSKRRPDQDFSAAQLLEAANVGDVVGIYPPGAVGVDLYCAEAWAVNDLIMSDGNGKGIICTAGSYYVARAENVGVINTYCPVTIEIGLAHA